MYNLTYEGHVLRLGTAEVRRVIDILHSDSGDRALDDLIDEARGLYASYRQEDRLRALERLWDAFERLKTVELPGGDKKQSVEALLLHIDSEPGGNRSVTRCGP